MAERPPRQRPYLVFLHDADVAAGPVGALGRLAEVADLDLPRHPGFGSPDDGLADGWDSVADLAQYHAERLRRTGRRVHLLGAGFGGWVALDLAVRARELLASLCLVCLYGVKLSGPTEPEFADLLLLDPDELVELGWADPAACRDLAMPGHPADSDDETTARAFAERAALARYRTAGRCSGLQAGGVGPSRRSGRAVLLFDVLAEHRRWCACDGSGEVGGGRSRLAW